MAILWNWTNFTAGESDMTREGPQASVQKSVGLSLRKTPGEVTLGGSLVDTGWIIDGAILTITNLAIYGGSGILITTRTGKIYIDGVLKQTLNTGTNAFDRVVGIGYMNSGGTDYLYYFSLGFGTEYKIHRTLLDGTGLSVSYRNYTSSAGNTLSYIPVLSEATKLIFGTGNRTFHLDNLEVIKNKIVLSDNEQIAEITVFQNRYRIYSNLGGEKGFQYFWNGTSLDFDYKSNWEHTTIAGVTNDGGYDYAISGVNKLYSDLYKVGGTEKAIYRANKDGGSDRHFSQYISSRKGIFYISGTISTSQYGIYTMGNYYPGYPEALYCEHLGPTQELLGHCHGLTSSHFACYDGKVYYVAHNDPVIDYNISGYLTSLIFDGGKTNSFIAKQIAYAYVGFANVNASAYIQVYARADGGSFKLLKTISSGKGGVRIDRNEFIAQSLGDFFDLEYKVVLNGNGTNTPIFRGIETYITTNIKH